MEGKQTPLSDSGNGRSISPLSPFPPVQSQTHEPTLRVPSSVRSAMFIVTPTPDAWPSSSGAAWMAFCIPQPFSGGAVNTNPCRSAGAWRTWWHLWL